MNTGPIAFNISVAVTPERDGSWMVDSIDLDNDGSGDVYYTRELPPGLPEVRYRRPTVAGLWP